MAGPRQFLSKWARRVQWHSPLKIWLSYLRDRKLNKQGYGVLVAWSTHMHEIHGRNCSKAADSKMHFGNLKAIRFRREKQGTFSSKPFGIQGMVARSNLHWIVRQGVRRATDNSSCRYHRNLGNDVKESKGQSTRNVNRSPWKRHRRRRIRNGLAWQIDAIVHWASCMQHFSLSKHTGKKKAKREKGKKNWK